MGFEPGWEARFAEQGWIFDAGCLSSQELAGLESELDGIMTQDRPENIRSVSSGRTNVVYCPQRAGPLHERLSRDARTAGLAQKLLGSPIYLHQCKVVIKRPGETISWPWHQDYAAWKEEDGMPAPRAVTVVVSLDRLDEFCGTLALMPGTHQEPTLPHRCGYTAGGYPLWSMEQDAFETESLRRALAAVYGPPGSLLAMHCNLAHASGVNLGPSARRLVLISYNAVDNAIRSPRRPDWVAARDFTPIRPTS